MVAGLGATIAVVVVLVLSFRNKISTDDTDETDPRG
jgi:hypothetical protein